MSSLVDKSLAAYAIKPKGMNSGVKHIITQLFTLKDKDLINRVLINYKADRAEELRMLIECTNIIAEINSTSPTPSSNDWTDSFWDVNYSHLKQEYYYDNYISHMVGDFSVIILESHIKSENVISLIADLKGRTTFVRDITLGKSPENVVSHGKGIRGEFVTEAVILTDEVIDHLICVLSPQGDVLQYLLELQGKNILFPQVIDEYKASFYRALPNKLQNNLNSHRIHSIDDIETIDKSLKWLQKKGIINSMYDVDINNLIARLNGKQSA